MDAITETLRREVTLDCYQGTSLERAWEYVAMAQRELAETNKLGSDTVNISESFKCYIWPFIQTTDNNFAHLTLNQVEQKYPELKMRGTEAAINTELFGRVQGNRKILASEKAFLALQLLARARAEGVTQVDLKTALDVDARSMFHYIKVLDIEGLVTKVAAFTNNGHTNLIFLRRFAKTDTEESAQNSDNNKEPDQAMDRVEFLSSMIRKGLRKKISDILQQSETGVMVESDVMDVVKLDWCNLRERKYFHRVTRELWENGCIEVVMLQVKDSEGPRATATSAVVLSDDEAEADQSQTQDQDQDQDQDREGSGDEDGGDKGDVINEDDEIDNESKESADPEVAAIKQEQASMEDAVKAGDDPTVKQERKSRPELLMEKKKRKRQQVLEKSKRRRMEQKRMRECLREGYSFRRCLRFIKPYVQKLKVRDRLGIPTQSQSTADKVRSRVDGDIDADADAEAEEEEEDDGDDSDANADSVDFEAVKEKEDVRYLLSKDEVHIGLSTVMPLETQIFRLIALSGRNGTVAKALQFILRENSHKLITRILMRLEKTPYVDAHNMLPGVVMNPIADADKKEYIVTSVDEFVGREHRKRFFANPRAQAAIAALTAKHAVIPLADDAQDTSAIVDRAVAQIQSQIQGLDMSPLAAVPNGESGSAADNSTSTYAGPNLGHAGVSDSRMDVDSSAEISNAGNGIRNSEAAVVDRSVSAETGADANGETDQPNTSYGHISDIIHEARERKIAINGVIRERVILGILERDKMSTCDIYMLTRCEKEARAFVLANRNAPEMTQSMVDSALKYTLDKKTLMRTVKAMAAQEKVWLHILTSLPETKALNRSRVESIVIARDVDPHGPLVDAFIAEVRDRRALRPMHSIAIPRKVTDEVSVTRTKGAAQRDAIYKVYAQNLSAARVVNNVGGVERWKRINRCKNIVDDNIWERVAKRLYSVQLRIARMTDLHAFLASALPDSCDGVTVFDNCAFRSSYFFSHLPLELYLQLCGGLSHLPFAHRYIRYGEFSADLDSDDEGDDDSLTTSPIEDIEARLATPISKLPPALYAAITSYVAKSRVLIQPVVYAMYLLRLLRPINTVAEVASVDSPSDSRDPAAVPHNTRVLSLGYQLVRHARLVNRETVVNKATTPVFEDDRVFDILSQEGIGMYWDATEKLHRNAEPKLPATHPLSGIDNYRYWTRKLTLNPAQAECLKEFVDDEHRKTPLDDPDALKRAAEAAEVSVELARRFYRNVNGKMAKAEVKRRNANKRSAFIRERIRAAKEKAIAEGKLPEVRKKPVRQLKRRPWSESESNLVAVAYAIMRNHAHSHRHPFLLHNMGRLFPNRAHVVNPTEGVRARWARLRRDPAYASMADTLYVVWKYVLRDAVEADVLYDEPDLTDFDLLAASNHYREVLNQISLDALVEKYADEINEDIEGGTEALQTGKWTLTKVTRDNRKGSRQPRIRNRGNTAGGQRGPRLPFTYRYRLPTTMVGNEDRYLMVSTTEPRGRGLRAYIDNSYPEDTYLEGVTTKSRRRLAYEGMLVAHDGIQGLGDHFSQVTTLLSGSGSEALDTIAVAAKSSIYPDCMASLNPVERTVDVDNLVKRINCLIIGNDDMEKSIDAVSDGEAADTCMVVDSAPGNQVSAAEQSEMTVSDDAVNANDGVPATPAIPATPAVDPAEQYAQVATMQAMLINLTLTPESEYDVTSGHNLLSTNEASATAALRSLSQNTVVNRLTSMATTTGMGGNTNSNNADADAAGDGKDQDLDAQANATSVADVAIDESKQNQAIKSTVVVHETTGVLRVVCNDAPRIGQNSEGFTSSDDNAMQERNVPGRGISISEKFLFAISSTLPFGYVSSKTAIDPLSVANSALLTDGHLSSGEFSHLCRLISDGALWLRQEYSDDPLDRVLGAFAGFKNQDVGNMLRFNVTAVCDQSKIAENNHSVNDGLQELSRDMQELAQRLVVCIVDFLGPLGVSVYELKQLFGRLLGSVPDIPPQLISLMSVESQISSFLRNLVSQGHLASVGSSDLRYVSIPMFHKHWVVKANDTEYLPYVGQNLGGTVNSEYTMGMLTSLVGHILDSPGISMAVLMRRYYAPFVPRAEVARYLQVLVDLGIVRGYWDPESFGGTTTYRLAHSHYQHLNKIHTCSAIKNLAL
ncbi:hypothetical protein H4R99_003712 [Coemansia sp. RSA 1722]|nr:hypothetical protein H4R99_003712 [Coemansia sp. RSA 1722]